jgi:hypothetical protein
MKTIFAFMFSIFVSLAGASPIDTVDVRMDRYTYAPDIVHAGNADVHAGQYSGTIDRDPATAWCAELTQVMHFGTPQEYRVLAAEDAYGAETALQLSQLLSWANSTGQPGDAQESAALQLDIWRIQAGFEPLGDYPAAPLGVRAVVLHHNDWQDLLIGEPAIAVPVSEPNPAALFLLGIGLLIGYLATRRQPKP